MDVEEENGHVEQADDICVGCLYMSHHHQDDPDALYDSNADVPVLQMA